jgi:ADP-ribose pyrophosphatase YjhB (NUDIX family)
MNNVGVGVGVIVLNNEGKVLLILRNSDREKADSDMRLEGTYTLPSGKVLYNEKLKNAGKRKLKDEVFLDVSVNDLDIISISNDINEYAHYVTIGMIANKYSGEVKLKKDEFVSYDWFDLDNLPINLCEPSKKIINNYLEKKIYSDEER